MRILHLAPLWFPVSPDAVGGIETYLPVLLAALERRGCRNVLIASGDSNTSAELIPAVPTNLVEQMGAATAQECTFYEQHQLMLALQTAPDCDLIHSHVGSSAYALSAVAGLEDRVLHTHHNPVYQDLEWFVSQHPDVWFSTVSEFQGRQLRQRGARRCHVIRNGVDVSTFTFEPRAGSDLLFLGRLEYEKGPDLAIRVARELGLPLTIAGPIIEQDFFDRAIGPNLSDQIRYVGIVNHHRKNELFGQAGCVLMPSRVAEGFGMVSVEAMACGTPVVALGNGGLPENIEPGLTGFCTDDESALASLAIEAMMLDRVRIRARAGERFDMQEVANMYWQTYSEMLASSRLNGKATERGMSPAANPRRSLSDPSKSEP